jgi:hypothetical protein
LAAVAHEEPTADQLSVLTLNNDEQLALAAILLKLMTESLNYLEAQGKDSGIRRSRLNHLRFAISKHADQKGSHAPLGFESDPAYSKLLRATRDETSALQIIVAAAASQPWVEDIPDDEMMRLPSAPRAAVLRAAGAAMPGAVDRSTIKLIDKCLGPSKLQQAAPAIKIAGITLFALAGVALTAGVAAPAIGGAVGAGAMGLSGAAATSAGLAALGGGSLASGGLGMAGGTAVLGALGGFGGAGLGAAATSSSTQRGLRSKRRGPGSTQEMSSSAVATQWGNQIKQLSALITAGETLSDSTARRTRSQATMLEIEISRLLKNRAMLDLDDDPGAAAVNEEILAIAKVRRELPLANYETP